MSVTDSVYGKRRGHRVLSHHKLGPLVGQMFSYIMMCAGGRHRGVLRVCDEQSLSIIF